MAFQGNVWATDPVNRCVLWDEMTRVSRQNILPWLADGMNNMVSCIEKRGELLLILIGLSFFCDVLMILILYI